MAGSETSWRTYEELANLHALKKEARQRDWFLVLAADAAMSQGWPEEAERLRQRLLLASPYNLLKPFASFAEALRSSDILLYIEDLKRQYPLEQAEMLLQEQKKFSAAAGATGQKTTETSSVGADKAAADTGRDLKVFRFQEDKPVPPPPRPAPHPPIPAPRSAGRPPRPYEDHGPVGTSLPTEDEAGAWIPALLFVLALAIGLGLAGFFLLRPIFLGG